MAIDDVGTGHNGLSYILKLGVDIIKIDKMFVDALGPESHSQAIVETLVDLARNLRMQIVAEGVENFEQVVYLRDLGHHFGAGVCVRAAAAGGGLPATGRGDRSPGCRAGVRSGTGTNGPSAASGSGGIRPVATPTPDHNLAV